MFCSKCGNQVADGGDFCNICGTSVAGSAPPPPPPPPPPPVAPPPPPPQQYGAVPPPPPPPQYNVQQPPPPPPPQYPPQQAYPGGYHQTQPIPHYAPGGFAEMLHSFAGTTMFMVAIIMFSAGGLLNIFMNFNIWSIFSLGILALPVTGFWMMFVASKQPRLPEKSITALKLFKASIIIDLVVTSLAGLICVIVAILIFSAASYIGGGAMAIGLVVLLIAGGMVTFIIIYFKAVLQMLAGIGNGFTYNSFNPLPGIKTFTILTYIMVGFSVLGAISTVIAVTAATAFLNNILWSLPDFISGAVRDMLLPSSGVLAFQTLCTLLTAAGTVMCIIVLNQFNTKLIARSYGQR